MRLWGRSCNYPAASWSGHDLGSGRALISVMDAPELSFSKTGTFSPTGPLEVSLTLKKRQSFAFPSLLFLKSNVKYNNMKKLTKYTGKKDWQSPKTKIMNKNIYKYIKP